VSFALVLLAIAAQTAPTAKPAAKGHSVTITLDAPVGGKAYVTGHLLNCRMQPSLDAQILTTIPQGMEVSVRKQQSDWQFLKLKTKSCWVNTRYLATGRVSAASEGR
jgi:uncharacterized protein YgiM (DUF1202 family)